MHDTGEETLAGDTSGGVSSPGVRERGHERGRERVPGLQRGDQLGRYTVLELLGQGGMGLVYAAYDPQLDRRVAVKVLRARGTRGATERARQRLLREAQAMAKLSHPNVVAVHDAGTVDNEVFIAMEFVDGMSLERWLAERPRAWREVVAVFAEAGRGLAAAHAVGLVHRDFKPANVLIDRAGRTRVTDFGLVYVGDPSSIASSEVTSGERAALSRPHLTDGDGLLGTPAYMAPEQHARTGVDARTDQFGFCIALYEALFSHHPFGGDTVVELATAISVGQVREVPSDTDVPAHVRRVVMRGLSREPQDRWPTMEDLLAALLDDPARRRRRWLGAVAVVGGIVGVVVLTTRSVPAATEPPPPCEGAGEDIDGVWSTERREAIAGAFVATKQPHAATVWARSAQVIDGYAERWQGSAIDACEATRVRGEQSDSLFDLRRACLDRRLHELDVRLGLLAKVDEAMVDHGFEVATALTPIDVCEDAERLRDAVPLPEDPARARQVSVLLERMAALQAHRDAGRAATIAGETEEIVELAVALGHAPTRAEARRLAADVQEELGHWKRAEALLMLAAEDAGEGRDDRLLAKIWSDMPYLVGYQQARFADATLLAPAARAALARVGRPDDLVIKFEQGMGAMLFRQGDRQTARLHYLEALARSHEGGGGALQRSKLLNNIGVLHMVEGDYDTARDWFLRAHAAREGLLRPDAPQIVDHYHNLGNLALAQGDFRGTVEHSDRALAIVDANGSKGGPQELLALLLRSQGLTALHRFDEARTDLDRALVVSAELHGPRHAQGFGYAVWAAVARLERELGNLDEGREAITRAVALSREVLGEDNPDLGQLLHEQAAIELRAGNLDLATELVDDALRRTEAGFGADHPLTAAFLRWRGSIDLAQSDLPEARERLERAVEILERRHGDAQELARGRFDLARCLSPADRARARRLAEQARERLAADAATEEIAQIDAWLADPTG
jgi:tetratricopeptide (TPR) repeat protein/predicted Ser/Thr protein kinase